MHEEPRRRDCTEEPSFEEGKTALLQRLHLTAQEFDFYLEGFHASVGLNPQNGAQLENTDLFVYTSINATRFPSVRIAYSFDDTTIHLWYVDLNPISENGQ